jgi:hypothetical protein
MRNAECSAKASAERQEYEMRFVSCFRVFAFSCFDRRQSWTRLARITLLLAATVLAAPLVAQTPIPDFCGCRDNPNSLGAFDTRDKNTWPPGTTVSGIVVTLPVPADGVLVFDSMRVEWAANQGVACCTVEVDFQRNAANTPVTLLVKGDVVVANTGYVSVRGAGGGNASADVFGAGGLGGNGGFRGGDGAYRLANGATDGGVALGPAGGVGATGTPAAGAGGGTFIGAADLLPLVGGSGGGGGRSTTASTSCSAGGGGGGGGALSVDTGGGAGFGVDVGFVAGAGADGAGTFAGATGSPGVATWIAAWAGSVGGDSPAGGLRGTSTITRLFVRAGAADDGGAGVRGPAIRLLLPASARRSRSSSSMKSRSRIHPTSRIRKKPGMIMIRPTNWWANPSETS